MKESGGRRRNGHKTLVIVLPLPRARFGVASARTRRSIKQDHHSLRGVVQRTPGVADSSDSVLGLGRVVCHLTDQCHG